MSKQINKPVTKLKIYISRDDKEMLREKNKEKKYKRISDYDIDAM